MHASPRRTVPRSAISGLGCRIGGKSAAMHASPRRTVPRSAISGLGCRIGGKPVISDPQLERSIKSISYLLDSGLSKSALFGEQQFSDSTGGVKKPSSYRE